MGKDSFYCLIYMDFLDNQYMPLKGDMIVSCEHETVEVYYMIISTKNWPDSSSRTDTKYFCQKRKLFEMAWKMILMLDI